MGNISKIKIQNTIHDIRDANAYVKPSTGIPAADLASGVIPDVSSFITKAVDDLTNYYTTSQTYTQSEVNQLIGAINQFKYEIAASTSAVTSPASNVLYLIGPTGSGSDKYEEYVYTNSTWTKIGDTSVDLSGYVTNVTTAAGSHIAENGTPTVTANTVNGVTTLTFDYLKGADGIIGHDGAAATITIGTVTTGEAGTSASVTNSGTSNAAVLDFVIPRGATGPAGADGLTTNIVVNGSTYTQSSGTITLPNYPTVPTVGTAAAKNYTTSVTSGSDDLVTSGAVYSVVGNIETLLAAI